MLRVWRLPLPFIYRCWVVRDLQLHPPKLLTIRELIFNFRIKRTTRARSGVRKRTTRLSRFTLARDFCTTNNLVHISLCRQGYREVIAGSYYACKWYFALSWNWHENRIRTHSPCYNIRSKWTPRSSLSLKRVKPNSRRF